MEILRGVDAPVVLNLLKFDSTYESGATVSYVIYDSSGVTVVAEQTTAYNATFDGYLDTLDVSADWASQEEGNYILLWKISGVSLFPAIITEELSVFTGGEIESGYGMTESMRLLLAVMAGKASGGGTENIVYRDVNDSKDRVTAVVDRRGNRTSIVTDVS